MLLLFGGWWQWESSDKSSATVHLHLHRPFFFAPCASLYVSLNPSPRSALADCRAALYGAAGEVSFSSKHMMLLRTESINVHCSTSIMVLYEQECALMTLNWMTASLGDTLLRIMLTRSLLMVQWPHCWDSYLFPAIHHMLSQPRVTC